MRFALYHDTQHDTEAPEDDSGETKKPKVKSKKKSSKKKLTTGRKKSKKHESDGESDSDISSNSSSSSEEVSGEEDSDEENTTTKVNRKKRARTSSTVGSSAPPTQKKKEEESFAPVDEESERFQLFQTVASQLFRAKRVELLTLDELLEAVNETVKGGETAMDSFGEKEAQAIIEVLEKNNKVMFRDGNVYQI